jgi:hypothetical protein
LFTIQSSEGKLQLSTNNKVICANSGYWMLERWKNFFLVPIEKNGAGGMLPKGERMLDPGQPKNDNYLL